MIYHATLVVVLFLATVNCVVEPLPPDAALNSAHPSGCYCFRGSGNPCACLAGYNGTFCDNPICGTCTGSGYACQANAAGAAPNCTCQCKNGVCNTGRSCTCNTGWTGTLCDVPVCSPACTSGKQCYAPNTCVTFTASTKTYTRRYRLPFDPTKFTNRATGVDSFVTFLNDNIEGNPAYASYLFNIKKTTGIDEWFNETRYDTYCLDFQRAPHAKLRLVERNYGKISVTGTNYTTLSLSASSHDPVLADYVDLTERYVPAISGNPKSRVDETEIWPYHVIYTQKNTLGLAYTYNARALEHKNLKEVDKYFNYGSATWAKTGYLPFNGNEPLKETSTYYGWRRKSIEMSIDTTNFMGDLTLYYPTLATALAGTTTPLFGEFTFVLDNQIGGATGGNNHPWFDFNASYDNGDINLAMKLYNTIITANTFIDTTPPPTSFVVW